MFLPPGNAIAQEHAFFKPLFFFLALIGILEVLGKYFGLFEYRALAFDKLLHFLGGISCGIFGIVLLTFGIWNTPCTRKTANRRIWCMALTATLLIGVVSWEILQGLFPVLRDASDYNWHDTVGDAIFDMVGGAVAASHYQLKTQSDSR